MDIRISAKTKEKLATKHGGVTGKEIRECFENREGPDLFDTRAEHLTDPRTRWFIAPTNHCRLLKIVFVPTNEGVEIKTAYEPNEEEIRIYRKYGLKP
ncbi:ADP-ribosyl-(dinitrogen reductase) hydrolase [Dyella psychrodurans]|uniref:ADP-ribosyl-(Dinitrogen reductase) hydrolase n=1 Tax=Dyella psychrodurans TaxID=1927960 RepID=A0A370X6Q5_9GAMM|nr:ADP-ribosyl-(dinitrogen reductase) hydrolase [Dyella psychrodurans]RDS84036.1 ADP-ribosyl-(dinitrogen reductase) hydrolase [Dyella psychrodurans]